MSGGHQRVNLTPIFKEHAIVFTLSLHYSSFLSPKTFVNSHGSHIMTMLIFPKSTLQLRYCFELQSHRFCLFTAYTHTFLYMYFKFYKSPTFKQTLSSSVFAFSVLPEVWHGHIWMVKKHSIFKQDVSIFLNILIVFMLNRPLVPPKCLKFVPLALLFLLL